MKILSMPSGSPAKKYIIKDGVCLYATTSRVGTINASTQAGYCEFKNPSVSGAFTALSIDVDISNISEIHVEYKSTSGSASQVKAGFITNYGNTNVMATVTSVSYSTVDNEQIVSKPAGALNIGVALDNRYDRPDILIKNLWYE